MRIFALFIILLFPLIVSSQVDLNVTEFTENNYNENLIPSSFKSDLPPIVLNDSIYLSNKDTIQQKKITSISNDEGRGYVDFATGVISNEYSSRALYVSIDLGINLGFIISDIAYLDVGGSFYVWDFIGLSAHITPGVGFNLLKKKVFVFAGAGLYLLSFKDPGYNFNLRINYNLSRNVSLGLDSRLSKWTSERYELNNVHSIYSTGLGDKSTTKSYYSLYSMGLNLTLRLN